jgi:hypothetical protein
MVRAQDQDSIAGPGGVGAGQRIAGAGATGRLGDDRARGSHRHGAEALGKRAERADRDAGLHRRPAGAVGRQAAHGRRADGAQPERGAAELAQPAHRHPRRRHQRVLRQRAVLSGHVHGRGDDELLVHEHARPVRHGARRGATRPAEQLIRPQHHRRCDQLHHEPAQARRCGGRLRSADIRPRQPRGSGSRRQPADGQQHGAATRRHLPPA